MSDKDTGHPRHADATSALKFTNKDSADAGARHRWCRLHRFCRHFILDLGHDIVVIDKLIDAGNLASLARVAADSRFTFEKHDICDAGAAGAIFVKYKPEVHQNQRAGHVHADGGGGPLRFLRSKPWRQRTMQFTLSEYIKERLRHVRIIAQLHRQRQVPAARGRLHLNRDKLEAAKRINRDSLNVITDWIDDRAMKESIYRYGTSAETRKILNYKIKNETTYSDLMVAFCKAITHLNYLEIGVSVGKNFWQVLNCKEKGSFWGLDIENLNPVLERKLAFDSRTKIESSFKSNRTEAPHVSRFSYNGVVVAYSAGDVYDDAVWNMFDGQRFSLIFSDASHTPEAIRSEWHQITSRDLLDRRGFTIVWDDLTTPAMRAAFNDFTVDCGKRYGIAPNNACLTHVRGWVGSKEPYHPIGIISSHGFVV
jgi:hypothetical protein